MGHVAGTRPGQSRAGPGVAFYHLDILEYTQLRDRRIPLPGQQHPGLFGVYLFADFCTGRIWGGYQNRTGAWSSALLLDSSLLIASFGEDEAGELYVADLNGGIYRVVGLLPIQVTALAADLPSPQPVGGRPITWTATVVAAAATSTASGGGPPAPT